MCPQNPPFPVVGDIERKVKVKKTRFEEEEKSKKARVSVQGVESLWGDCRFIPADIWGHRSRFVLFCSFLKTFHYKNDKKYSWISKNLSQTSSKQKK